MDQGNGMYAEQKPKSDFLKMLLMIIVTAGIAGGGTWYYFNSKFENQKTVLNKQIDDLNAQIKTLETAATTAESTASTATANETAGWKTYTNSRVNYSFEYPASGLQLNLDETIKYPSTKTTDSKTEDLVQFATSSTTYSVRSDISGHVATVEAWITGGSPGPTGDGFPSKNLSDYTKVTIGGVTAYTSKSSLVTFVEVGTKYYTITARVGIAPKTGTDTIYSHLLDSFAFTK